MIILDAPQQGGDSYYPLVPGVYTFTGGTVLDNELLADAKFTPTSVSGSSDVPALVSLTVSGSTFTITISWGSSTISGTVSANSSQILTCAHGSVYLLYGNFSCDDLEDGTHTLASPAKFERSTIEACLAGVASIKAYSEAPIRPAVNCEAEVELWRYVKTAPTMTELRLSSGVNASIAFGDNSVSLSASRGSGTVKGTSFTSYKVYDDVTSSVVTFAGTACSSAILNFGGAVADKHGNVIINGTRGTQVIAKAATNEISITI